MGGETGWLGVVRETSGRGLVGSGNSGRIKQEKKGSL